MFNTLFLTRCTLKGEKCGLATSRGNDKDSSTDLSCPKCGNPCCQLQTFVSSTRFIKCGRCNHFFVVLSDIDSKNIYKGEFKTQRKPPPSPQKIMDYLNINVVGQDFAKKVLSVAVYNHYKRIQYNLPQSNVNVSEPIERNQLLNFAAMQTVENIPSCDSMKSENVSSISFDIGSSILEKNNVDIKLEKSNILMVGPTGSGKTLIAQTIARCLDVPFAICDCTTLTQAGYVGEDIESVITKLLQDANYKY